MTEKKENDVETLTGNELKKAQARAFLLAAVETGFVRTMFIMRGNQKQKVWYKTTES